ncbi:hypothetical protein, partial [Vibrio parahaemolyticus]|uniref:hypothetical protein n=1 Tax=Vibrio parahaemolyticus TaxID=670 RepID=UPI002D1E41AE
MRHNLVDGCSSHKVEKCIKHQYGKFGYLFTVVISYGFDGYLTQNLGSEITSSNNWKLRLTNNLRVIQHAWHFW